MLKQAKGIPTATGRAENVRPRMTYAEFLRRHGDDASHLEWVNGEVVEMSPISVDHNDLTLFLIQVVGAWVQEHRLGELKYEPFQMKTGLGLPGRAPDLLYIAKRNLPKLKRTYLAGPADLVVEVISEGSRGTDRGDKYYEYEKGGVREYWLLDPERKQAEFHVRGKDRLFHLTPAVDGIYHSTVLKGLWLELNWLWQKPSPTLLHVLRAWKLI